MTPAISTTESIADYRVPKSGTGRLPSRSEEEDEEGQRRDGGQRKGDEPAVMPKDVTLPLPALLVYIPLDGGVSLRPRALCTQGGRVGLIS
jgi:hypothetical protein